MRINPDSSFVHITVAIFDSVVATFLFVLCCVPVLTIGASATAMHKVMQDIALGVNKGVLRPFFTAFKDNFKVATGVWLIALLVGAIVAADIVICFGFEMEQNIVLSIMQGLTIGCGLLYASVASYLFAGISHFHVTWKQAIRNAVVWMVKKPFNTIGLLIVNATILVSCFLAWMWAFPVVVLLLYVQAMILNSAFDFKRLPSVESIGGEEEIYYE